MRQAGFLILIAILSGPISAQDVPQPAAGDFTRSSVAAATDSAVQQLIQQIESAPITMRLTVGQFLNQTGGRDSLRQALQQSDPVGGPRWLDDHTCQVRLEVSGTEVVADLANIAVKRPGQSPIHASDLPIIAADLSNRWFAATGTSTAEGVVPQPPADSAWSGVSADQRRRAVQAADVDAGRTILHSISAIQLSSGYPLGDVLSRPQVASSVGDWLASRPVTAVEYLQDDLGRLQVRVTLAADPAELFDVLRASITASGAIPDGGASPQMWDALRRQVLSRMAAPVGRSGPSAYATTLPLVLPSQPPPWAGEIVDTGGRGGPSISYLRADRAAETDALIRLRRQVMNLPLAAGQTVGQAMQSDPHFAHIVDRAISRSARLYKSVYNHDGTVDVRVSLDLGVLWSAIAQQP